MKYTEVPLLNLLEDKMEKEKVEIEVGVFLLVTKMADVTRSVYDCDSMVSDSVSLHVLCREVTTPEVNPVYLETLQCPHVFTCFHMFSRKMPEKKALLWLRILLRPPF